MIHDYLGRLKFMILDFLACFNQQVTSSYYLKKTHLPHLPPHVIEFRRWCIWLRLKFYYSFILLTIRPIAINFPSKLSIPCQFFVISMARNCWEGFKSWGLLHSWDRLDIEISSFGMFLYFLVFFGLCCKISALDVSSKFEFEEKMVCFLVFI